MLLLLLLLSLLLLLLLLLTALHENDRSPYAKPKSREIGLKRSFICKRISLKLTQRRQVGRSPGKKGAPSLFENCPLKRRRHENTSELLRGA